MNEPAAMSRITGLKPAETTKATNALAPMMAVGRPLGWMNIHQKYTAKTNSNVRMTAMLNTKTVS
jgi:hypothetical protein